MDGEKRETEEVKNEESLLPVSRSEVRENKMANLTTDDLFD